MLRWLSVLAVLVWASGAAAQDSAADQDPVLQPGEVESAAALALGPGVSAATTLESGAAAKKRSGKSLGGGLPQLGDVVTRVTTLEKLDDSSDRFALVESFSYANGLTTEVVVNVSRNQVIESTRQARKGVVPPLGNEALALGILAKDAALGAELGKSGAKLADFIAVSAAVNPKPFRSIRVAKVRLDRDGVTVTTRLVDLAARKIIEKRQ